MTSEILPLLIGGCIGLVLSVPAVWVIFALLERWDRNRVYRWERRQVRENNRRNRRWAKNGR